MRDMWHYRFKRYNPISMPSGQTGLCAEWIYLMLFSYRPSKEACANSLSYPPKHINYRYYTHCSTALPGESTPQYICHFLLPGFLTNYHKNQWLHNCLDSIPSFLVAFLAGCDDIHRYTVPFRGYITSENERDKPHDFMCYNFHWIIILVFQEWAWIIVGHTGIP